MSEIIKEINEVYDLKAKGYCEYDGYEIVTNKQVIKILIDNGQSCCENWGHLISEDDTSEYIGASLKSIVEVDNALKATETYINDIKDYESDAVFINLETNKGTLQFALYNEHNGYYGHAYIIESEQFSDGGIL